MNVLDQFDVDATADADGLFEPSAVSPTTIALLDEIEKGSQEGRLSTVREAFTTLYCSSTEQDALRQPRNSLMFAVEGQHEDVVDYLLSQGVQSSATHVKVATLLKNRAIIQLLLDHGGDISEPLGCSDQPALA